MHKIVFDPDFSRLCPKLTEEEYKILETSIAQEGCRESLKVWANLGTDVHTCLNCLEESGLYQEGYMWHCQRCAEPVTEVEFLLVDGHNRYGICQRLNRGYEVEELGFATRAEVINWIIDNQLGRRNLTEEQKSYLRGKRHRQENWGHGGVREQDATVASCRTAERLAQQFGVSPRTIYNDARFADAVDTIEQTAEAEQPGAGQQLKAQILGGKAGASRQEITQIGKAIQSTAQTVNAVEISDYAIVTDDGELMFKRDAIAGAIAEVKANPGPTAEYYRLCEKVLAFRNKYTGTRDLVQRLIDAGETSFMGAHYALALFEDIIATVEVLAGGYSDAEK